VVKRPSSRRPAARPFAAAIGILAIIARIGYKAVAKVCTRTCRSLDLATTFSRTMRSLHVDRFRRLGWALAGAVALLAVWLAWFFLAQVSVYETSQAARLEVRQAAHPVESPVAGRVQKVHLEVGAEVRRGDVLVELDTEALALRLAEEKSRVAGAESQLVAARSEIAALEQAAQDSREAADAALAEAKARHREAVAAARFADQQLEHVNDLWRRKLASEFETRRARSEAEQLAAAVDAAESAVLRVERDQRASASEYAAQIGALRRQAAELAGVIETARATIDRLIHEADRRTIRAPVSGTVGEVAELQSGSFVESGERLAAIVPEDGVKLVAYFTPQQALGRIRAGQQAHLRLAGFPWSRYGSVDAVASRVGSEVRDGRVRVEFDLQPDEESAIPMQHGLPGNVEVEVDRVSPAVLLLRTVGMRIRSPQTNPEPRNDHIAGAR
jgi:membrane fusion protein (multidrug efflux system)